MRRLVLALVAVAAAVVLFRLLAPRPRITNAVPRGDNLICFGDSLTVGTGAVLVPNLFDGIMGKPALMSDPIHPNANGYAVMAEHFHRALRRYL